ncbi:hypothetical protein DXG03_009376 [Asterophora parasitica]|uniref:Tyrosinase copper-binding domain-containing protein n=1 Tax=Asterophora parasitica TaxID=117018 RepID=A0A9P7KH42_9AGAR|nr:hypothetical protein DXG03_009376 [Asterophora parasitica]
MDPTRAFRLSKLLDDVSYGRTPITPQNTALFIEAISTQRDRAACMSKVIASKSGLDAVQAAIRFTLTPAFFNGPGTQLLTYLQSPELKDIGGGYFLTAMLLKIVEPPIFWDAFRHAFTTGSLTQDAQLAFGWLLHHLVCLPTAQSTAYRSQAAEVQSAILGSSDAALRTYGQKIKRVLETCSPGTVLAGEPGPGGRHDNDFINFREISILPTSDEITSTDPPFLRRHAAVDSDASSTRLATHLDNQFRLLREDMMYEMREELQIISGKKKGYHKGIVINGLALQGINCGVDNRRTKWGITLKCRDDLPHLKDAKDRKKFLADNRNFLRHQSLGCLRVDGEIVAFPTVHRDEDLLAKKPPVILIQIEGEATVIRTLLKLKSGRDVQLVQINTAVFSYEPVLKALQRTATMPLSPELLLWTPTSIVTEVTSQPSTLVETLRANPRHDIQSLLKTPKSIRLDTSQAASLIAGLTQKVSLIQGPPGTGKSFIGSLIAKAIHDFTSQTILVVCYTNHALDDILTSLLDIGIPQTSIVRLGGKSTPRTEPTTMQHQKSMFRRDKGGWALIDSLKVAAELYRQDLEKRFGTYISSNVVMQNIMDHLEFEAPTFFTAFQVPKAADGSTQVGKKGRVIDNLYLLREWSSGRQAGIFASHAFVRESSDIWTMSLQSRQDLVVTWTNSIYQEQVDAIHNTAAAYNRCQDDLSQHWAEKDTEILRTKRIIGCTTTAAAKYSNNIQAASPDIVLVEEAGEILESHVLTAMGPKTSQVILIGDHKQLRPKVNKYELTVEKEDGYDLNRSLFERLILRGYPHAKLSEQHRMRPEISALIRSLTYPELVDAPKTHNRPDLRGAQNNIIFVNHDHPEDNATHLADRRDGGSTSSKQNTYEVEMVLKILRYLAQQGYGTDSMVILTPYLGQLQKLQQALKKDNDPILNDLDSFDLVRAGLVPAATAKMTKRPIRLATIGKFNSSDRGFSLISDMSFRNDIGFMFSPERLNVLLSRARNALIMIGNAKTFINSRKAVAEKKRQKEYELQQKRDAAQLAHTRKMAELDEAIDQQEQLMRDLRTAEERTHAIRQKEMDLQTTTSRARDMKSAPRTAIKPLPISVPQLSPPVVTQDASNHRNESETSKQLPPRAGVALQPLSASPSEIEWQRQKEVEGDSNTAIDTIMDMTGLEDVKDQVLIIKGLIETKKRQGVTSKDERLNVVLLGNPGTGKTTVARSYGKLLALLEALPGDTFVETTGSRLAHDGVAGAKKHIEEVIKAGGGVIFVDEAYQLTSTHNFQGGQVLDFLLAEMENNIGTIVFILAGYRKEMEKFFEHNPGLASRIPFKFQFVDYTDAELLHMLKKMIERRFEGKMQVECGIGGLYTRIAVRRLGRGRGTEGFGNARALQNMLDAVLRHQAKRLSEERRGGKLPNDLLLCKSDLIGPDPSKARSKSAAWAKLQSLVGLQAVKDAISNLTSLIDGNYHRELQEREPVQISLNRVFLGSPGTGKTSVAKLYGQVLADLGVISNGEVVVKNPADFIGAVLGESETKTKAILANAIGKVLVIDEAYMLYNGGGGGAGKSNDIYKTAVIDTMVAEIQSVPGEDRCVLLLGYKDQMVEMFQNVNPGLSRRFAIEDAFNFEDFSNPQLLEILNLKLKNQDLSATDDAKAVAIEVLDRARNRPNFGNAGDVENIIGQAKNRYQKRKASNQFDVVFEPQDFDPDYDRGVHASANLQKLFEDIVGCEEIITKLARYQQFAQALKARNIKDRSDIPTNFVFKGPPGTGKTTVARKMGQVYYDMGFLSSKEVMECSASDLVGQYVGQTGPKTKQLLEKAVGRVLFIDEAYRLGEGHFAKEAIDELVASLTLPKFKSKLIVILAGYDQDMNSLLSINAGLASRFPEEMHFRHMEASHCLELLQRELAKKNIHLSDLTDSTSSGYIKMSRLIKTLATFPTWGNARDIIELSKRMSQIAILAAATGPLDAPMVISTMDAVECMENMLSDQKLRSLHAPKSVQRTPGLREQSLPPPQAPASHATSTNTLTTKAQTSPSSSKAVRTPKAPLPLSNDTGRDATVKRDAGVTDAIWNQLQALKRAEREKEKREKAEVEKLRKLAEEERRQKILVEELARAVEAAKQEAERQELKRQREAARLKALRALEERQRLAAALEEQRRRDAERKAKDEKAQKALRSMGVCVAGYRWQNMGSGYLCEGGSHFVSNAQLGI